MVAAIAPQRLAKGVPALEMPEKAHSREWLCHKASVIKS
jgi:hypothetical protein